MTSFLPIIVIGAARSGTKVLRDSLATAAGAGVVPYDVGYVWRHGNEHLPHDVLQPSDVTPRTRKFTRAFLSRYSNSQGLLVEKTVGNAFRAGFVAEILPEAKFVYIERDGVDVAVSTAREWQAPTDWRYIARKSRHFPLRHLPSYGVKFLRAQTVDRSRGEERVGTWGPRYPGIDADLGSDGLLRVCARQWKHSVLSASAQLAKLEQPVVKVSYAELVASPESTLTRLLQELGLSVDASRLATAAGMIDGGFSRPARPGLTDADRQALTDELGSILKELGYDQP